MTPQTLAKAKSMLYLMKSNKVFIILDRESTSLRPNIYFGKITELSAIKVKDGKIIETFDTLVDPEIPIPKKIIDITGITNAMCEGKPKFKEVVSSFIKFCEGFPIIGHNVGTDIDYINFFANKIGKKFEPQYIDTITLARYIHRKDATFKTFNLQYLFDCYKLKVQGYKGQHHRALYDVMMTYELFKKFQSLLSSDIYHANKADCLDVPTFVDIPTIDLNKIEVRSVNLWKKTIGSKDYCRLYIKIYYNKNYNDIFYDFIQQEWGVKGTLSFILPDGYKDYIMSKIALMKKIPSSDCYNRKAYERLETR